MSAADPEHGYDSDDYKMMWIVLSHWVEYANAKSAPRPGTKEASQREKRAALDSYLDLNFGTRIPPTDLLHVLPRQLEVRTGRHYGWIVGDPIERENNVIPVVTFEAIVQKPKVKKAAFRVGLFSRVDDDLIVAEGWRFEQNEIPEEDEYVPHPFAHAQAIIGWDRDVDCLIHPPHDDPRQCNSNGLHLPEGGEPDAERLRAKDATFVKHPAFPLPVKTLTGLLLAMLVSLYGAARVHESLAAYDRLMRVRGPVMKDLYRLGIL